jgi:protein KRI1
VIRRKDNKRILQRQTLKERKEEEKKKKREELKRLKNLKKEELAQKLKQIQEMAGGELIGIEKIDLTKDFDPAEHDQVMNQMFTEEYFETKDCKLKKPVFENDIDISDLIVFYLNLSRMNQNQK